MSSDLRTAEHQQADSFVRRLANLKSLYAVSGEEGLARVPSQKIPGREVVLLWTERAEAEKWADCLAQNPRVKQLSIGEVMSEFVPALIANDRMIGPDWTAAGIEPECEPAELAEHVRLAAVDGFMERVARSGNVYILEDSGGPAMLVSGSDAQALYLPCWSQREAAEQRLVGPWQDHLVMRIPLANFVKITLPWLAGNGHRVGPDHVPGTMALELEPEAIAERIAAQSGKQPGKPKPGSLDAKPGATQRPGGRKTFAA